MAPPPIPDDEWEEIWAPLAAKGWRHEGVPGGVNYFFPPGVSKGDGSTLRRDYFDSKRQVVNHVRGVSPTTHSGPAAPSPPPEAGAAKRKRESPTAAEGGEGGGEGEGEGAAAEEGGAGEALEERRSARQKNLRLLPTEEELEAAEAAAAAKAKAEIQAWLAAQPVASHRSEWLGPANALVPPNRDTGEPLTKKQQEKVAPHAARHQAEMHAWFAAAPRTKAPRKSAPFNRMVSNRALVGFYGLPGNALLKEGFFTQRPPAV